MTFTQQDKDALKQNWDQIKTQIQTQFPDADQTQLDSARQNPDQLVDTLANSSGQDRSQIEQQLRQMAQQFSGRSGQSGQTQS